MVAVRSIFSSLLLVLFFTIFAPYSFADTTNELIGAWNGYNQHSQVIECIYNSEESGLFELSVWRGNGEFVREESFEILANGSKHILLSNYIDVVGNDLENDFGSYSIKSTSKNNKIENLNCLTAIYKFNQNQDVEYAYTIPARSSSEEIGSGFFDARDFSNQDYRTYNWLSVINPSRDETLKYSLSIINAGQKEIKSFSLAPKARRDHALHDLPQSSGMYKIEATSGKYFSYLSKYLRDLSSDNETYIFGLANENSYGVEKTKIQISTTANADNYITIGNTYDSSIRVKFSIRDASGLVLSDSGNYLTIPANTSLRKIHINPILDPQNAGRVGSVYAEIEDKSKTFILKSSFYGKDASNQLKWAYINTAKEPIRLGQGEVLISSVNKFLNAANFLKLSNTEDVSQSHTHQILNQRGNIVSSDSIFFRAKGSVDLGIHESLPVDNVGMTKFYGNEQANEFTGQLLRVYLKDGEVKYITPTPLFTNSKYSSRDLDGDGIRGEEDNCPNIANPLQSNLDSDALGDACDDDKDGDGVTANLDCNDLDRTKFNTEWYVDRDLDGFKDQEAKINDICSGNNPPQGLLSNNTALDNCPEIANNQQDIDNDAVGDACDSVNDNFIEQFSGNFNSLKPYRDELFEAEISHFLNKTGFGYDKEAFEFAKQNGLNALVDKLIDNPTSKEIEADAWDHSVENRNRNAGRDIDILDEDGNVISRERHFTEAIFPYIGGAKDYWVHQMVHGNPLYEKVALIMHNHFAVNHTVLTNSGVPDAYMASDYLEILRKSSMGNFNEILIKMTEDVSMMRFLNLDTNTDENTDENYGREFLELFTLKELNELNGEENYNHQDILSFSKAFTGLKLIEDIRSYDYHYTNPDTGEVNTQSFDLRVRASLFDPTYWRTNHTDPQAYTYFEGKEYEANAAMNYVQAAGYIAQHPGLATHLGTTLYRTLVNPETSQEMIASLTKLTMEKEFNVKEILRVVLKSESMFADDSRNVCVKAPIESQVSFMKASGIPLETKRVQSFTYYYDMYISVSNGSKDAGQDLFSPPSIFGWSGICGVNREGTIGRGYNWLSGDKLLARDNSITNLLIQANRMQDEEDFVWSSLLPSKNASPLETLEHFLTRFGVNYSEEEKSIILEYLTHVRLNGETNVEYDWNAEPEIRESILEIKLPGLFKILAEDHRFQVI